MNFSIQNKNGYLKLGVESSKIGLVEEPQSVEVSKFKSGIFVLREPYTKYVLGRKPFYIPEKDEYEMEIHFSPNNQYLEWDKWTIKEEKEGKCSITSLHFKQYLSVKSNKLTISKELDEDSLWEFRESFGIKAVDPNKYFK